MLDQLHECGRPLRPCGLAVLAMLLISCQNPALNRGIDSVPVGRALDIEEGTVRVLVRGQHGSFEVDRDSLPEAVDVQRVTITNRHPVPVFVRLARPGWPDFTNAETILASILDAGMTDKEKALAIYEFVKAWRFHWHLEHERERVFDPVKLIGVYGFGHCGETAWAMEQLARRAGLEARVWELYGHIVSELYFDGRWHILDADLELTYDHPDGHLASVEELAASPSLDPVYGHLYSSTQDNHISPSGTLSSHSMALRLSPGDSIVFEEKPVKFLPRSLRKRFDPTTRHPSELFPSSKWAVGRLVKTLGAGQHVVEVPYALREGRLKAETCCIQGRLAFGALHAYLAHDLPVDETGARSDFSALVVAQPNETNMVWLDVNVPTELELAFQFAPRTIPWIGREHGRSFEVFAGPAPPGTLDAMSGLVEVVYELEQIKQAAAFNLGRLDDHADDGWTIESPDG